MFMFYLFANFKSQHTAREVQSWLADVAPAVKGGSLTIALAPSFPYLALSPWPSSLARLAQDVSPFPSGAYTGAVNARQLKDLGVSYCLVGHSERRHYFHETYQEVANKVGELLSVGITPVLCLDRPDFSPQLAALEEKHKQHLLVAYEPVGAIGGDVTAPVQEITSTLALLRSLLPGCPILYGGSVHVGNLDTLLPLELNGLLVASASLSSTSFLSLLTLCQSGR